MKRILKFLLVSFVMTILLFSTSAAVTPPPTTTFTLISGLPAVMHVGDTVTAVVQVDSDQPFNFAEAMSDDQIPGRGVVGHGHDGHDRSGPGTTATVSITFTAKSSTANFAGGVDTVSIVAAARYGNAGSTFQRFDFNVQVP